MKRRTFLSSARSHNCLPNSLSESSPVCRRKCRSPLRTCPDLLLDRSEAQAALCCCCSLCSCSWCWPSPGADANTDLQKAKILSSLYVAEMVGLVGFRVKAGLAFPFQQVTHASQHGHEGQAQSLAQGLQVQSAGDGDCISCMRVYGTCLSEPLGWEGLHERTAWEEGELTVVRCVRGPCAGPALCFGSFANSAPAAETALLCHRASSCTVWASVTQSRARV